MFVTLIIKSIYMRVYLNNFLIKSRFFVRLLFSFFLFFSPCYSVYKSTLLLLSLLLLLILHSSIITIINVFVIKNLTLSLLFPLLLVFLFLLLLLILLYLLAIVSFSLCCYSYQGNIAIIYSFVNFLICTFVFHL